MNSNDEVIWLELDIQRGPIQGALKNSIGLIIHATADPQIEQFMKLHSGGETVGVEMFGTSWLPVNDQPLQVYKTPRNFLTTSPRYSVNAVGREMLPAGTRDGIDPLGEGPVNLSFLRLVGISSSAGVKFGLAGAFSKAYGKALHTSIAAEMDNLVNGYISPIRLNLRIVSKR